MTDDPVAEARREVEADLDRSMAGGPPAFGARRHARVKKRFLRTDAVADPETGEVRIWDTGHLDGAWPDGNRYVDFFAVRDGLIVRGEVWNDSAEILLARAGLAEAPL